MTAPAEPPQLKDENVIGMGLLAGSANVIMQLGHPAVGYGVYESRVDTGNLFKVPVKRTRTTLTYLAVAFLGTPQEKAAFRKGVNRAHAKVYSTAASPVSYNAFDPSLQLWVAACLYRGVEDVGTLFGPPLTEEQKDLRYEDCKTLGTTLQVPLEMWPKDRAAFEEYWQENLAHISIDDTIREHLLAIASVEFLPFPFPQLLGRFNRFVTAGFLPASFREQMGLSWGPRRQRRFELLMRALRRVVWALPPVLRRFPYNLCLWDLRMRLRLRRPMV